jgi:hypothetical protein
MLSARLVWARGQVLEDQVRRLDRRMNCVTYGGAAQRRTDQVRIGGGPRGAARRLG